MTDEEIISLRKMNVDRHKRGSEDLWNEYIKMDHFLQEQFKKNAIHRHFKTRKLMNEAMSNDYNPHNTFSYGKKEIQFTRENE